MEQHPMIDHRAGRRGVLVFLGFLGLAGRAAAAFPTPEQAAGPFYPPPNQRPEDTDWDLVKIEGRVREAGGEIMHLSGHVLERTGPPLADALVEIWQCDANGRYHHVGDSSSGRPLDADFQGFGAIRTDAEGRYRFRTIKPVSYPGRTPHIHARVVPRDRRELITQIYLAGHPLNPRDWIFRSLGVRAQSAATIDPERRDDGDLQAEFDFVV
jgi:protocatechuate 3,4-dioxygenase, beta subunit